MTEETNGTGLLNWLKKVIRSFDEHMVVFFTFVFFILVLFLVPQIKGIFHFPTLTDLRGVQLLSGIGFYGFIGVLVLLYICCYFWVIPPKNNKVRVWRYNDEHVVARFFQWFSFETFSWFSRYFYCFFNFGESTLHKSYNFFAKNRKFFIRIGGITFLLIGGYILHILRGFGEIPRTYQMIYTFSWSLMAFFFSGWLLAMLYVYWEEEENANKIRFHQLLFRVFLLVFLLNVALGELVWLCCKHIRHLFSFRAYTTWAMLHIFASALMLVRGIQMMRPHRFVLLLLGFLGIFGFLYFVEPPQIGQFHSKNQVHKTKAPNVNSPRFPRLFEEKHQDLSLQWMKAFLKRAKQAEDGPLIFMAVSGGGSRAALYTSLVLETIFAPKNADTQFKSYYPNLVLLSGVSGGALSMAYRVFSREQAKMVKQRDHRSLVTAKQLKQNRKGLSWHNSFKDSIIRSLNAYKNELEKAKCTTRHYSRYVQMIKNSFYIDDMCTDFMAPIIRGAIYLQGMERGESLSDFLEKTFLWEGVYNHPSTNQKKSEPFQKPLLIFNSTDVDHGTRFAMGFPPLPVRQDYPYPTNPFKARKSNLEDDMLETLSEWNPFTHLRLAEAVRLAANFPFAYAVPYIEGYALNGHHSMRKERKYLNDGGVFDNTGIDSIVHVLRRIGRYEKIKITKNSTNMERALQKKAEEIVKLVAERGFLLVEVDAGAKPWPLKGKQTLATLYRSLQSLNTTSHVNASLSKHRYYFKELNHLLKKHWGGKPKRAQDKSKKTKASKFSQDLLFAPLWRPAFFTIEKSVMTAMSLGEKDKKNTMKEFLKGIFKEHQRFRNRFNSLKRIGSARRVLKMLSMDSNIRSKSAISNETQKVREVCSFLNRLSNYNYPKSIAAGYKKAVQICNKPIEKLLAPKFRNNEIKFQNRYRFKNLQAVLKRPSHCYLKKMVKQTQDRFKGDLKRRANDQFHWFYVDNYSTKCLQKKSKYKKIKGKPKKKEEPEECKKPKHPNKH